MNIYGCSFTDAALTFLADRLRFNMDDGLYIGIILIDLQKAFETVDYSILATKLKAISADRPSVLWFESDTSGRNQLVNVNGRFSELGEISCGCTTGVHFRFVRFLSFMSMTWFKV